MERLTSLFSDWNSEYLQKKLEMLIKESKTVQTSFGSFRGADQRIIMASDTLEPGGAFWLATVSQNKKGNPDFKIGYNYITFNTVESVLKKAGIIIYDPQNI